MQKVTLLFRCQFDLGQVLLNGLAATLPETRTFDGCVSVETYVYADNPDTIVLIEEWESKGHHERYLTWRIETGLIEMLEPLLAGPLELHYLELQPV
jgi:quinol monooxygenase YgiN